MNDIIAWFIATSPAWISFFILLIWAMTKAPYRWLRTAAYVVPATIILSLDYTVNYTHRSHSNPLWAVNLLGAFLVGVFISTLLIMAIPYLEKWSSQGWRWLKNKASNRK